MQAIEIKTKKDVPTQKTAEKNITSAYRHFFQTEDFKKIDSGHNFFTFISHTNKDPQDQNKSEYEIFLVGDNLTNIIPCESNSHDVSIHPSLIQTLLITNEGQIRKLVTHQKEVKSEDEKDVMIINPKKQLEKVFYSYLYNFTPIQVSCGKTSMAILMKSLDDSSSNGQLRNQTAVFNEIQANLKNKKMTFQSYFLSNISNERLASFNDKQYKEFAEPATAEKNAGSSTKCLIYIAEFEQRLKDLLGQNNKMVYELMESIKKTKIISGNKINILEFYQHYKGYNSYCNTKLIVIGEFVKNWYKFYEGDNKLIWKAMYNLTLSFELPNALLTIKQVELGDNHMLLLTVDGEIYSCGDGSKGATGNFIRKFHSVPAKVIFPFPNVVIEKIAAGSRHSLALDTFNTLYSWGCGACGCLGLGNNIDAFEPKQINALSNTDTITQIDAGDNYSACVTSDGSLYTWGNIQFGRLGLDLGTNSSVPQKVFFPDPKISSISSVKCGFYCTLVITKTNEIYTMGEQSISPFMIEAKDKDDNPVVDGPTPQKEQEVDITATPGKTPINSNTNIPPIIKSKQDSSKNDSFCTIELPTPVQNEQNLRQKKELKRIPLLAVCGYQFIAIISEDPILSKSFDPNASDEEKKEVNCWLWGNFKGYGKTFQFRNFPDINRVFAGLGTEKKKEDKNVLANEKKEIKIIQCGQNNTAIVSTTGDLYVFGSYLYQVAHSQVEYFNTPLQPKGMKVLYVALGANHIIFVTASKDLYGAGRNIEGQLGIGSPCESIDIKEAVLIKFFQYQGVRKCYAAENYSVVITMNIKSRVWLFGDIPFLQNFAIINRQMSPKEAEWGEIDKIACGSTHLLLLEKDPNTSLYTVKSIGNGMYGKLGDGDETGKNHYEPVRVELPYHEIKSTKDVKMRCGKYTSGVLIKETGKEGDKSSQINKLYMWGLCNINLFTNIKEVGKKHKFGDNLPVPNTQPILTPSLINFDNYFFTDFSISEGISYFTTQNYELKCVGNFIGRKTDSKGQQLTGEYLKVRVGVSHAAALSKNGKLFTWGSNVMNKLGLPIKEDSSSPNNNDVLIDMDGAFFVDSPENVVKFNTIFEEAQNEASVEEQEEQEKIEPTTSSEQKKEKEPEQTLEMVKEKEKEGSHAQNIFSIAKQKILYAKPSFEELEKKLSTKEKSFQDSLKTILAYYKNLLDYRDEAKTRYTCLYNIFNFKYGDTPLNVRIKNSLDNWKKFPSVFLKFKSNYKALLSALHTHPCYFLKIYENDLFPQNELYKIIKQIYSGIRNDRFSQLLLITLCKGILELDIKKQNVTSLDQFAIVTINDGKTCYSLFGRLCRLLFKKQKEFMESQNMLALFIIGNIFSKVDDPSDCDDDLFIKFHPEGSSRSNPQISIYQRNARTEKIFEHFEYFNNNLLKKASFEKNALFSYSKNENSKSPNQLPEICLILIQEIVTILKIVTHDIEKIYDWLGRRFSLIMFSHLIKILEDPTKNLVIDAALLIDRSLFNQFMKNCNNNFYSVAYAFRFCFHHLSVVDPSNEIPDDETTKQIEKLFKKPENYSIVSQLKNIMMNKRETDAYVSIQEGNKTPERFDLEFLKEFFKHSLNDGNYIINFSLYYLRRLHEVIGANLDKIRIVLGEKFDVIEQIFNKDNLLKDGGLLKMTSLNTDNDKIVQFKLITKILSIKNPMTLMKCRNCKCILLNVFISANSTMFYDEFDFISRSTAKGKFINILKMLEKTDTQKDKLTPVLKKQCEERKDDSDFRDSIYHMFTFMAVDKKDALYLTEDIISDQEKLMDIMFNQSTTDTMMKKYAEEIVSTYDKMKELQAYHKSLEIMLQNLITEAPTYFKNPDDSNNPLVPVLENHFLCDIYKKIRLCFEKGFGNNELLPMLNSLHSTSMFVKLNERNESLPRSEILIEKLSNEMKKKLQPVRQFDMKKLREERVVRKLLLPACKDEFELRLQIVKNENFEFVLTLLRINELTKGFWKCGKNTEENAKKLHSSIITNQLLKKIIKISTMPNEMLPTMTLTDFIEVNAKPFVQLLKKLTNVGFYVE